jgi:carbon-monoxide dehydrogenase medium subunit
VATGAHGERVIPIEEFFVSLFSTALEQGEILTEIRIPLPPPQSGGAYFKLERKVGDFATAAVAAEITLDNTGTVERAGIGLTNVGPTPIKAKKAEDFLRGKKPDPPNIEQASRLAADQAQPSSDLRGPAEYKKGLVKELAKRSLSRAAQRAAK